LFSGLTGGNYDVRVRNSLSDCYDISTASLTSPSCTNLIIDKTVSNTQPNAGEPFLYYINLACNSSVRDCEGTVLTDCLDPNLTYLNHSPKVNGIDEIIYDPITHCISVTFDATPPNCVGCNPDGINTDEDDFVAGSSIQIAVQVMFDAGAFDGTSAENVAVAIADNAPEVRDTADVVTVNNGVPPLVDCNAIPAFSSIASNAIPGGQFQGRLQAANLGTQDILGYYLESEVPSNVTFTYIRGIDHEAGYCTDIDVYYKTSDDPANWIFKETINSCNDDFIYANELAIPAGERVTNFRFDFGTLVGSGVWNPSTWGDPYPHYIKIFGTVDASAQVGDEISFCNTTTGISGGITCTDDLCDAITLREPVNRVSGGKDIQDPVTGASRNDFSVGDTYTVELIYYSSENMGEDLLGAYMIDVLPPCMEYVPGSWRMPWGASNADFQSPQVNVGNMFDGRQYVEFIWADALSNGFVMEADGTWSGFAIEFEVLITGSCSAGPYVNDYYFGTTGNTPDTRCGNSDPVTDMTPYGQAATYVSNGQLCHTTELINVFLPAGSAGLESIKEVKGTLDSGYTRYPNVGQSVEGGLNDYRLCIKNPNDVPVDNIVIVDVLPRPGDTEVLNSSVNRNSDFAPVLTEGITAPSGITVEYSTEAIPCRNELASGSDPIPFPTNCIDSWSQNPPSDLSTVTAVRYNFGSIVMNRGDEYCIEWEMRVPIGTTPNDVAWNSFAYIADNANTNNPLLPSEPIKVGIEIQPSSPYSIGDFVWEDLNGNGLQDSGEPGVNNVRVNLYEDSNGNGIAEPGTDALYTYTVTSSGGQYVFSDFPLGDYFVEFTNLPTGYNPTLDNRGSDDSIDSDGQITQVFSVNSSTYDRDIDFGIYFGIPCDLSVVLTENTSCEVLNLNSGMENSGTVNFNTTYRGVPAFEFDNSFRDLPEWYPLFLSGGSARALYLNDTNDVVNNPEGDKFMLFAIIIGDKSFVICAIGSFHGF